MEVVDKREVSLKSPNMEREGLIRALDYLSQHVKIGEVITDASTSVHKTLGKPQIILVHNSLCKVLATRYPDIHHSYDVWHKSKKLRKAVDEVYCM